MAKLLLGDSNSLFMFGNATYHELFFVNFKRRIFKDEIKKDTVSIVLQVSGAVNDTLTLSDAGAAGAYTVGSAGDEAVLYSGSTAVGKVYYNVGVVAFATGVFVPPTAGQSIYWSGSTANKIHLNQIPITGSIDQIVDGFRNRINLIQFRNQTNLHNTIYFCRALNSEFNYSSNPTFVDSEGRIIPTSGSDNQTRSYITTVGLYDINDTLLGVAKLSQPVKKSPDNEVTVRVRLAY